MTDVRLYRLGCDANKSVSPQGLDGMLVHLYTGPTLVDIFLSSVWSSGMLTRVTYAVSFLLIPHSRPIGTNRDLIRIIALARTTVYGGDFSFCSRGARGFAAL